MNKFPFVRFEKAALQIIDGDRGANYPKKTEFHKCGHCVFLNTGNVTKSGFNFGEIDFISEKADSLLRKGKALRNDIVLTTRGTVGNVAFYGDSIPYQNIRINSGMILIRTNQKEIIPYYLYVFLRSDIFKKQVFSNGSGSAQPQLPISALRNIVFPLPNIGIQQKIAAIFSALDTKIDCNNRINAELESMAKLIYDYWFVQFDFPGANGKPYKSSGGKMVYNESLKREIPESWEAKKLSSILKSNYASISKNDSFDVIEYLDTGNLTKNVVEGTEQINSIKDKVPSRAKRIVHKNDILYSTVRPNLCHYGIIKKPTHNMVASTGFVQLASKVGWISSDLIYTFLTSSWVTSKLHQIAALAVSAYPSISPSDILELDITLPKDEKLIEPINLIFDTIYSKVSLNQQENLKLTELRDWLVPMLMNGQVTVNDA